MKIDEIQSVIMEMRDALAKHELLPVMLRANDALDALERMKPTNKTIEYGHTIEPVIYIQTGPMDYTAILEGSHEG